MMINVPIPRTNVMIPVTIPTLSISFCFTRPVEKAIALGGVLIGKHIAALAAMAIPMSTVEVPPIAPNAPPIPLQTTAKIGTKSAAVAVFEMKLLSAKQMMQAMSRITNGFQLANGMLDSILGQSCFVHCFA